MGSLFSGLFGGGSSTSAPNNNAGTIGALGQLANTEQGLGNQLVDLGNNIYGPAFNQFNAGASGQLTPAQSAVVQENLGAMNTSTGGLYGNLGLGGSTMEGQDMNANNLRSLAEQSALEAQSETLGLQGLQTTQPFYTGAGTDFGASGQALYNAGQLQTSNQADLNNAISSLGSKATGSLSSLLGGAGAGAAASQAAGTTGSAINATDASLGGSVDAGAVGSDVAGGALTDTSLLGSAGLGTGTAAGADAASAGLLGFGGADATGLGLAGATDAGLAATGGSKAASAIPAVAALA